MKTEKANIPDQHLENPVANSNLHLQSNNDGDHEVPVAARPLDFGPRFPFALQGFQQ